MERLRFLNKIIGSAAALAAMVAVIAASAPDAKAALITGDISIVGGVIPNTANIQNATFLDFTPIGTGSGAFRVASCSGDFAASLTCDAIFGSIGAIKDLQIDLASIVSIDRSNINELIVRGLGTVRGVGFNPTPGTWLLTANQSGTTFSYSGSSGAVGVPEPGTLGMFGLGLLGLGFLWRRRDSSRQDLAA